MSWQHKSRHCRYCGKVGPRVQITGGWAHRRCIPTPMRKVRRPPLELVATHKMEGENEVLELYDPWING